MADLVRLVKERAVKSNLSVSLRSHILSDLFLSAFSYNHHSQHVPAETDVLLFPVSASQLLLNQNARMCKLNLSGLCLGYLKNVNFWGAKEGEREKKNPCSKTDHYSPI